MNHPRSASVCSGAPTTLPLWRPSQQMQSGEVLAGRWEVVGPCFSGASATVYQAVDRRLGNKCAVKLLDTGRRDFEERLHSFREEARLLRLLSGNHRIVAAWDYDEHDDGALLVMEWINGTNMAELARAAGTTLPVPLVRRIYTELLEALGVTHASGIIHGDVSPGNILLAGGAAKELLADSCPDPDVRLGDFGLSCATGPSLSCSRCSGQGTAGYGAPELFGQMKEVSDRADIFAAAAVAYELLVGSLPMGRFPDPGAVRQDIDREFEAVILESLDTRAERRPSAQEALDRLLPGNAPVPPVLITKGRPPYGPRVYCHVEKPLPSPASDPGR